MTTLECSRCHIGLDDDGDGNCAWCASFSDSDLRAMLIQGQQMRLRVMETAKDKFYYPTNAQEADKPRVRWVRLLVFEGSEKQLLWHKEQSVFSENKQLGNVRGIILDDEQIKTMEEVFPELFQKELS